MTEYIELEGGGGGGKGRINPDIRDMFLKISCSQNVWENIRLKVGNRVLIEPPLLTH